MQRNERKGDAELMDDEQNRNLMRLTHDIRNRCVRMAADISQFLEDPKSDREKILRTAATFIEMIALDIDALLPPEHMTITKHKTTCPTCGAPRSS